MDIMSNSIDRTSARSTKGWISGDHLVASDQNKFLNDSEADIFLDNKRTNNADPSISLKRPIK